MSRRRSSLVPVTLFLIASPVIAQASIEVMRGPQTDVFGSCMPTLAVTNRSTTTIDYLQVDVLVRFRDGRETRAELKSAYRHGINKPIAPGTQATLKINPDEAVPLGGPCSEIETVRAVSSVCESAAGECSTVLKMDVLRP